MNYANIKRTDVANGPGIRVSLFVSGCTHGCRGCFNKEAWDFHYGEEYTALVEEEILRLLAPDYIRGLSVMGGEPMEPQNREAVLGLLRKVRQRYPQKDIWCYTGYDYEKDILSWAQQQEAVRELLSLIDVLVDGEFVEERKNLRLAFRGSENQRILDVKQSLKAGTAVWCEEFAPQ